VTAAAAREIRFTDTFGPLGWSGSLLVVILIHLAIAWYFLVHHEMRVEGPPPPPKAILLDLAQPAPLLGPQVAPPATIEPLPQPPIVPPSAVPPEVPRIPSLAAPAPQVETAPLPDLPKLPEGEVAPLPKPVEKQPPVKQPETKKPETKKPETKKPPAAKQPPKPAQPTQRAAPAQKALPIAPSPGALQKDNPIRAWQLAVINRLQPFMKWPEDAPYWIDQAAPVVQIAIDRQGHVLTAKVVGSSGYDSFDKAARKIFKRALTLPPPPPELPGNPLSFTMAVTFSQRDTQ
jgi:periplasmic protein TonB